MIHSISVRVQGSGEKLRFVTSIVYSTVQLSFSNIKIGIEKSGYVIQEVEVFWLTIFTSEIDGIDR